MNQQLVARFSRSTRRITWAGREELQQFLSSRSLVVRLRDKALLARLMKEAEKSPTAQVALAWAQQNDIRFIVDDITAAGGYYVPGTGVVGLCLSWLRRARLGDGDGINALVHEIRHAWQDAHGLVYLPVATTESVRSSPLLRDLSAQALFEADAFAHGQLARAEYEGRLGNISPKVYLSDWFLHWFDLHATYYGKSLYAAYAGHLGIDRLPIKKYAYKAEVQRLPPDYARREVRELLGRSFAGVNYVTAMDEDIFLRRILTASAAATYFTPRRQQVFLKKNRSVQKVQAPFRTPIPKRPLPDRRL